MHHPNKGLDLVRTVFAFLKERPEQKFTPWHIAEWIFETYPDECRQKQERSQATVIPLDTDKALVGAIAREISSRRLSLQKRHPEIKTTEGRPRRHYFTKLTDSQEIDQAEQPAAAPATPAHGSASKEHALYPLLSVYLQSLTPPVYSKRIDERRSRGSQRAGYNKWLHPDLVGMEVLSADWDDEIKKCVEHYTDKRTKLWSFEVKVLINRANVREAFFQAVSNSSWANYGYLVASEIQGDDALKELQMLASRHGIGVIELDATTNLAESQIRIPAQERGAIDWQVGPQRLTAENQDFREYIRLIRRFYQTGDIHARDWEKGESAS